MPLQIRRGTQAERLAMSQPLAQGELLYVTDDKRLYIGDNATLGGIQITGYTNEDAVDAAAAALVAGTHSGITFTYGGVQDTANRIDATVSISQLLQNLSLNGFNITGTGNINISGTISGDLKGSIFADNSTRLIDGTNGQINLDGTISGNIIPTANEVYDIGSSSFRFRDLYLSGSSIELGAATITATGSAVNLPAGSTVGGQPIALPTSESLVVDIQGSVFSDNSSIIVDGVTGEVFSSLVTADEIDAGIIYGRLVTEGVITYVPAGDGISLVGFNGTRDDKIGLSAGDFMSTFSFKGWSTQIGDFVLGAAILAQFDVTADLTKTAPRSNLLFGVGDNTNGAGNLVASLDYTGKFTARTTATTVYSVAGTALPSAAIAGAGARAFVSDATSTTFAAAYVGGGANSVPVYSDGIAWYIG